MENEVIQIVEKLRQLGWKISTMESCTGGNVINEITNIEGASYITEGGYVTYSNELKIGMGVSGRIINKYGVYSAETAFSMANACRNLNKCDIGIGVTGTLSNIDTNNADSVGLKVFYAIVLKGHNVYNYELDIPLDTRQMQKKYITGKILQRLNNILDEQIDNTED